MTHTYKVSGMTCSGCQVKVKNLLSKITGVQNVSIDLEKGEAIIDMHKRILTSELKQALKDHLKYQLSEASHEYRPMPATVIKEEKKTWSETYKPILLIFGYILAITMVLEWVDGGFLWMRWMNHFMAGFFLVFSFFKILNLQGFAESYSMYDVVAGKWKEWGYVYAFLELILGIAFLTGYFPLLTNAVTFIIMSVSIIGVLQSVLNKKQIKCACLGAIFNLPMSTVTIVEDALMIGMSLTMLLYMTL